MAGAATGWVKASAGPIKGTAVFVPPSVQQQSGLSKAQILAQIEAGCGSIVPHIVTAPKGLAKKAPADGLAKELLVVVQADGQPGVRLGYKLGDMWVVDTPYGHSVVHAKSGKALMYIGSQGKPTTATEAQALAVAKGLLSTPGASWGTQYAEHLGEAAQGALAAAQTKGVKLNGKLAFTPPPPPEKPAAPKVGDPPFRITATAPMPQLSGYTSHWGTKTFAIAINGVEVASIQAVNPNQAVDAYLSSTPLKGQLAKKGAKEATPGFKPPLTASPYTGYGNLYAASFEVTPPPYEVVGVTNGYWQVASLTIDDVKVEGECRDGFFVSKKGSKWELRHAGTKELFATLKTKTATQELAERLSSIPGIDWTKKHPPIVPEGLLSQVGGAVEEALDQQKAKDKKGLAAVVPEVPAVAKILCPSCHHPNAPGAAVCEKCQATLVTGPEALIGTATSYTTKEGKYVAGYGYRVVEDVTDVVVVAAGVGQGGQKVVVGMSADGLHYAMMLGPKGTGLLSSQGYKTKHGAIAALTGWQANATGMVQLDKETYKSYQVDAKLWLPPPPPATELGAALATAVVEAAPGESHTLAVMSAVSEKQPKVDVQAEIYYPFAIHPSLKGSGWTLTHAPSGYPITTTFVKKEHALAAVELAKAAGADWTYTTKAELKANKGNFSAVAKLGAELKSFAVEAAKPPPEAYVIGVGKIDPKPGQTAYHIAPAWQCVTHPDGPQHRNTVASKAFCAAYAKLNPIPPPSETQQQGVTAYQSTGGCMQINPSLGNKSSAASSPQVREWVKWIDETMAAHAVPYNVTVTRAAGKNEPDYYSMAAIEVGGEWQPRVFQSCSIDSPKNNGVLTGAGVRIHYRLPEGVKGLGIPMNAMPSSMYQGECEYLVSRGSRWRCVAKTVSSDGQIEAVMELIETSTVTPGQWDAPQGPGPHGVTNLVAAA